MTLPSIYGRDKDLEQLHLVVSRRRSFLLHGPEGVGKTLLLKRVAADIPQMLYCGESSSNQGVFRTLAGELFGKNNRHVVKICAKSGLNALKDKSAVSLRGIVTEGLREALYWIVLDHVQSPSQSYASALRDVCSVADTPLIAVARSAHMEDVGFLLPMFSDRSARFALRNFELDAAMEFCSYVADTINLRAINHDEVIEKIVRLSKGNPGAIIAMLRMAASPKYMAHQHVKLTPLYIDFRLSWGAIHG